MFFGVIVIQASTTFADMIINKSMALFLCEKMAIIIQQLIGQKYNN